jgi:hypothetical protein
MLHSTGASDSYYRPLEKELLEDYSKVVDHLLILFYIWRKRQLERCCRLK